MIASLAPYRQRHYRVSAPDTGERRDVRPLRANLTTGAFSIQPTSGAGNIMRRCQALMFACRVDQFYPDIIGCLPMASLRRLTSGISAHSAGAPLLLKAFQKADYMGQHRIAAGESGHMIAPR